MKKQLLRLIAALVMLAILGSVLVFASDTQTGTSSEVWLSDSFESYTAGEALPAGGRYQTPAGTVINSGDETHGKVLEGKTGSTMYLNVGKADKTIEFSYQFRSGSNFGGWGGLYVKAYYGGKDVEIYNIFSPTLSGGAMRISGPGSESGGLQQISQSWENDTWYKAKLQLSGSTLSVKTWKESEQEPARWNLAGTSTVVTPVDENSQIQIIFDQSNVKADAGAGTIWMDNLQISLPQQTGVYLNDGYDAYPAGTALPASGMYEKAAGTVVASGDPEHGNVLEAKSGSELLLPVGRADKQIEFDFLYKDGDNFGGWGGMFVKAFRGADADEIYAIYSPSLDGGQLRISGPSGEEAGGITKLGYSFQNNVWYKTKLLLQGQTLSVKLWKQSDPEPSDWTATGTSSIMTPEDTGSFVQILVDAGNGSADYTAWLDNLKITFPQDAETFAIEASCDAEIGKVTGAGTYKSGDEVTLTASINAGYQASYSFSGWRKNGTIVSQENPYTFTPTADGRYTAEFRVSGEPGYTYFTDDFESYTPGAAAKDSMPANYISFSELGEYRIAQERGNESNQVFTGHTSSVSNSNLFYLDCEIIDKEVSFDFRYDQAFAKWGGLFVKLHCQKSESRPVGDQYYFSINPNYSSHLIISCNEKNLSFGTYPFQKDAWYRVKSQLVSGELRIKVWPRGEQEPTQWTLSQTISGFTPVAEDSWFGMEFWNHPDGQTVNIEIDNLVMKTWRKLPEKESFTVTAVSADETKGTVTGGGSYLSGNFAKLTATPKAGFRFTGWKDETGTVVSTSAVYSFAVHASCTLTAEFEQIPVVIRSFMAEGLTQTARIDETTKTVRLRFASDADLANVYPYFYLDTGVETDEKPYQRMDLSSGTATIGTGTEQWTIYAEKNTVMQTFYVSGETGRDDNDGLSRKTAFQTLERAQQAVRELDSSWTGDVVVEIACGEYVLDETLAFTVEDSAPEGYAVIWQGTGNANDVMLSSGRRLNGAWTQSADVTGLAEGLTAWEYDATGLPYSRDLYVDGALAKLAIYVLDEKAVGTWALTHLAQMDRNADGYYDKDELANMYQWRNPSDIEFVYEVGWTYSILPVTKIEQGGDGSQVTMKADAFWCAQKKPGVQIDDPNFIQNCFEGLDSAGEWYFDRAAQKIYYITDGADPNTMELIMPTLDQLVTVNGTPAQDGAAAQKVHGLTFKGLSFAYTSYLRPHTYGQVEAQASYILDLDSMNWDYFHKHDYYLKTDGGVTASYTDSMRVSGCIFTNMSGSGIDFEEGCTNSQFVGNTVQNMCGNGITVGGVAVRDAQPYSEWTYVKGVLTKAGADPDRVTQYTLVLSNRFHGIGLRYTGSVGIFAGYVSDITIAHNIISDASYSGISAGWGWGYWDGREAGVRNDQSAYGPAEAYRVFDTLSIQQRYVIENNDISTVCQRLADGGAVYTLSNMPGSKLNGNYMHDAPVKFGGVYFDEATGGFDEISNNITYRVNTDYFYHFVGGLTDRQEAMQALWDSGNYLGVAPEDPRADETYRAVVANAGTLDAMTPPTAAAACRHDWSDWTLTQAATCTAEGSESRSCPKCGTEQTRVVAKTPHTEEIIPAVPATTTSTGLTEGVRCSVCKTILVEQQVTPKLKRPDISSVISAVTRPKLPFTDVSDTKSYYDAVRYVYEKGLMNGVSEDRFAPDAALTRAMVVTTLYRIEKEPSVSQTGTFLDVQSGTWYTRAVEWAAENGIVLGYGSGRFGPQDPVTREQLAAIMSRYAAFKGYACDKRAALDGILDGAKTSAYAQDAVKWALAYTILDTDGAYLRPRENATRAEVAMALYAFLEKAAK